MKFAILVSSDPFFDGVFQSALLNENSNGSYDVIRLISDGDGVVETLSDTERLLVRKTTNYEPETIFRLFIKKAKYSISVYNTEMAKLKVVYDDKSNPRRNDSVFAKSLIILMLKQRRFILSLLPIQISYLLYVSHMPSRFSNRIHSLYLMRNPKCIQNSLFSTTVLSATA